MRKAIAALLLSAFCAVSLASLSRTDEAPSSPAPAERKPVIAPEVDKAVSAPEKPAMPAMPELKPGEKVKIYVIPVKEEIAEPVLYIVRTGVKEAIAAGANYVVIDMDTLGGELGVTLEIMEILEKFKGHTVTYVDDKAASAGAFISAATQDIYFAPKATIGAAAAVSGGGEDIEKTMKEKIRSFLSARIRAISEGRGYRGDVVTAMMDMDYEFKIGDTVINPKGKLLTLTANEAMKMYGDPPQPLLGAGIFDTLSDLEVSLANGHPYDVRTFNVTWSIKVFRWFNAIGPVLIGLGLLGIYMEFQAGGHGVFAGIGVALLLLVFAGYNAAGLSGHEPMLVFLLGAVLIVVEVFFVPGTVILALVGVVLMLGSLVWGMTDVWPGQAFEFNGAMLVGPIINLCLGLILGAVFMAALARFLPESWLLNKMVVTSTVGGAAQVSGSAPKAAMNLDALVGKHGLAVTALRPGGQVEIEGRRYEARTEFSAIDSGEPIIVRGRMDFGLVVDKVTS